MRRTRGYIRGDKLAVKLVIAWSCTMSNICHYIGLEFRCRGCKNVSSFLCDYVETLGDTHVLKLTTSIHYQTNVVADGTHNVSP